MSLHIKRSGTPPVASSSLAAPEHSPQEASPADTLTQLPLFKVPTDKLNALLKKPYLQKHDPAAAYAQPHPDELSSAIKIIEQTSKLTGYTVDYPIPVEMQPVHVIFATGLTAAGVVNLPALESCLEDLNEIQTLSKDTRLDMQRTLYQLAYDACLAFVEYATSVGNMDVVSIFLDQCDTIRVKSPEIAPMTQQNKNVILEQTRENTRSFFITSAISSAAKGETSKLRQCLKDLQSVHQKLGRSYVSRLDVDPLYTIVLGKTFTQARLLEAPTSVGGDFFRFQKFLLTYSASKEVSMIGLKAFDRIQCLRDSMVILADLSNPDFRNQLPRQNRNQEQTHKIAQQLVELLDESKSLSRSSRDEAHESRALAAFLSDHNPGAMHYNKKSVEKAIATLIEKENWGHFSFENEADILHPANLKVDFSPSHYKEIEGTVNHLLQAGATPHEATTVALALLQVDVETYEHARQDALLKGLSEPRLELKSLLTTRLIGFRDAQTYFHDFSENLFDFPVEVTRYASVEGNRQESAILNPSHLNETYQRFYNYQTRVVRSALAKIEKLPYSLGPEIKNNDTHTLRIFNIELLQNRIVTDFDHIERVFESRTRNAVTDAALRTKIVDTLENIILLENNAERAQLELPTPRIAHVSVASLEEKLSIMEVERRDQRVDEQIATGKRRTVRFGVDEVRTYQVDRNNEVLEPDSPNIESNQFLYDQALKNVHTYASEPDLTKLTSEIKEVQTQATRLNRPFPEEILEAEKQHFYNVSLTKHMSQAASFARTGEVDLMIHHLHSTYFYANVAHRKSPNLLPIVKMGYAEAMKRSLSIAALNAEEQFAPRLRAQLRMVEKQAEALAKEFTTESIFQRMTL